MLQVIIWGIAAMLVLKVIDVLHQQSLARASENLNAQALAGLAGLIGLCSAVMLIIFANQQADSVSEYSTLSSSVSGNLTDSDTMIYEPMETNSSAAEPLDPDPMDDE